MYRERASATLAVDVSFWGTNYFFLLEASTSTTSQSLFTGLWNFIPSEPEKKTSNENFICLDLRSFITLDAPFPIILLETQGSQHSSKMWRQFRGKWPKRRFFFFFLAIFCYWNTFCFFFLVYFWFWFILGLFLLKVIPQSKDGAVLCIKKLYTKIWKRDIFSLVSLIINIIFVSYNI